MRSKFKLTGIGRKKSITCEPLDNENIFWPEVGISQDRFDAFWDYYTGRSDKENFYVEIEHNGVNADGIPVNGRIVSIVIE